jgi:hypothetical protein
MSHGQAIGRMKADAWAPDGSKGGAETSLTVLVVNTTTATFCPAAFPPSKSRPRRRERPLAQWAAIALSLER